MRRFARPPPLSSWNIEVVTFSASPSSGIVTCAANDITSRYSRSVRRMPDVEAVAYADPDPREQARAKKNPLLAKARMYSSYAEMFDRGRDLEVAAICDDNGARGAA
jgi:hypothetical protein